MQYPVVLTKEGTRTLAAFPDCPGCQTFAEANQDILARAKEALEGWLEVGLEDGEAPPKPSKSVRAPGGRVEHVHVDPKLAVALCVRWARQDAGLSQAAVARKMGVSQQQAAKLEQPNTNPTLDTLTRFARALGVDWQVALVHRRRSGAPRKRAHARG
jgi:predicted RNase H-like HicB family nuclease/DNA-binding XRE family transcriptional regulator